MVIEFFGRYSNMDWDFCSLRVSMMSIQDLQAFLVSVEKSGVVLFGVPLYITCLFKFFYFPLAILLSVIIGDLVFSAWSLSLLWMFPLRMESVPAALPSSQGPVRGRATLPDATWAGSVHPYSVL